MVTGVTKISGKGQQAHGGDQLGKKGQLCRIRQELSEGRVWGEVLPDACHLEVNCREKKAEAWK